jgi:hypothetical protein
MNGRLLLALGFILATGTALVGCNQSGLRAAASARYKPGQVWSLNSPRDPGACVVVVKVESHEKYGTIVHVSLFGASFPDKRKEGILHMPFTEQALDQSGLTLLREGEKLPPFRGAYDEWRAAFIAKQAGVYTTNVVASLDSSFPERRPPGK